MFCLQESVQNAKCMLDDLMHTKLRTLTTEHCEQVSHLSHHEPVVCNSCCNMTSVHHGLEHCLSFCCNKWLQIEPRVTWLQSVSEMLFDSTVQ